MPTPTCFAETPLGRNHEASLPRLERVRRLGNPAALIKPDTAERFWRELPGHAWDVVRVTKVMAILNPLLHRHAASDWEYNRDPTRIPLENQNEWRMVGGGRVVRKDRAIAWACSGGERIRQASCWSLAAQELALLGFPGLGTLVEVEEVILWLIETGVMVPTAHWNMRYTPYRPYSGSTGILTDTGWGHAPENPVGWVTEPLSIPIDDIGDAGAIGTNWHARPGH
jgi:hypothetical protein